MIQKPKSLTKAARRILDVLQTGGKVDAARSFLTNAVLPRLMRVVPSNESEFSFEVRRATLDKLVEDGYLVVEDGVYQLAPVQP